MDEKNMPDVDDKEIEMTIKPDETVSVVKKDTKSKKREKQDRSKEVDELTGRLVAADDQYQRLRAEYANYKRRTELEKEQLGSYVKVSLFKALLPALDSLERAAASPPGDEYKTGVDNTVRQLTELLAAQGLEEIPALAEPFDPELHNAVSREDAVEDIGAETVTEVYQKGYRVDGRVIRPAMVKVAN